MYGFACPFPFTISSFDPLYRMTSNKRDLTAKQSRVLTFLKDFVRQQGYPPTVREIADQLDMSGPHSAKRFLDMLEHKGYIRRAARSSRAIELVDKLSLPTVRMVPLVGRVRAGSPLLAEENIESTIALDPSIARWKDVFLLRVVGDSMTDAHITDGDLALVKSQPTIENGEIAVVLIQEEATIKRFYKDNHTIRLEPANATMQPIIIQSGDAEVRIVGKVVAILRQIEGKPTAHHAREL